MISVDIKQLTQLVTDLRDRQLPFATSNALNACAKIFQADERNVIQTGMIIRRPWVLQGVKIERGDFATKQKLSVTIKIANQQDFLDKFEQGGVRTPYGRSLVIPVGARPQPTALIPGTLRPKALGFREVGGSALAKHAARTKPRLRSAILGGSVRVFEGNKRTIMIVNADGSGVILQRVNASRGTTVHVHGGQFHAGGMQVGARDGGLIVLYRLKPTTKLPDSLHFVETAQASFTRNWTTQFEAAYAAAMATAR